MAFATVEQVCQFGSVANGALPSLTNNDGVSVQLEALKVVATLFVYIGELRAIKGAGAGVLSLIVKDTVATVAASRAPSLAI